MVAPHLDDGLKRGKWRNMLHFDPLWKDPNGYSYWDIMLQPILEAANEAVPAGKTFWYAVEGEARERRRAVALVTVEVAADDAALHCRGTNG